MFDTDYNDLIPRIKEIEEVIEAYMPDLTTSEFRKRLDILTAHPSLVGSQWMHVVRGSYYQISGFIYDSETDQWKLKYFKLDEPALEFSSSFRNFFSYTSSMDAQGAMRRHMRFIPKKEVLA